MTSLSHPEISPVYAIAACLVEWSLVALLGLGYGLICSGLPSNNLEQWRERLRAWPYYFFGVTILLWGLALVAWVGSGHSPGQPPSSMQSCFQVSLSPKDAPVCAPRPVALLLLASNLCLMLHHVGLRLFWGYIVREGTSHGRFVAVCAAAVTVVQVVLLGWIYQPGGIGLVADRPARWIDGLYGSGLTVLGALLLVTSVAVGLVFGLRRRRARPSGTATISQAC